jgi:hypothetical protein
VEIFFVVGLARTDIYFDFNNIGVDSIDGGALRLEEHWLARV